MVSNAGTQPEGKKTVKKNEKGYQRPEGRDAVTAKILGCTERKFTGQNRDQKEI